MPAGKTLYIVWHLLVVMPRVEAKLVNERLIFHYTLLSVRRGLLILHISVMHESLHVKIKQYLVG